MAVKLESLLADETFEREIECGHGTLKIKQAEVGDESCVVWDAALVLGKYLQKLHLSNKGTKEGLENKRIIELGAGTGVVGLMAAACGAAVCCTDLTSVVPLIELNKAVNQHLITGSFSAASLKWGQDVTAFLPCPDILLVADCIYYEESLTPLVTTLCDLSDFNTTVLLSYEERTTGNKPLVEKQFHQLAKAHFSMEEIPEEEQDSIYHSPDIYLWRLKRR